MTSQVYVPGSIHLPEYYSFWEKELNASPWVLDVLKGGYVLPFESIPQTSYEEDNNSSAKKDMEFVRLTIKKWADQGVVKVVKEKPFVVSPLTVATRTFSDGKVKKRLCWDGSRFLNPLLVKEKVTLSHLQAALEITEEGDFQCKYDLQSAYFHIKIHNEHVKYLGASFTNENGAKIYFVFLYMPFGLASAVHAITKLFKPIIAHLGSKGIRHTIFIDDGRTVSETKEKSREDFSITLEVIKKAGWIIEATKTDSVNDGSKSKEYLGFLINTENMKVYLTDLKRSGVTAAVNDVIISRGRYIAARHLAKVIGKMISCEPAVGPFSLIAAKRAYSILEETVQGQGWKANLKVTDEIVEDLQLFVAELQAFDGYPIRTAATAVSVVSIIGPPSEHMRTTVISNHVKRLPSEIWAGDASNIAVCAYSVKSENEVYYIGKLSPGESLLSSGHRELLTVKYALESQLQNNGPWSSSRTLYWLTDSTNLVAFLTKGSMKKPIQEDVLKVLKLARQLNVCIVPIHLLRDDPRISLADAGSKCPDSDDWSVDNETFNSISENYGPFTIDLFADQSNKKVDRFYSNFACPTSIGVDAFCHNWDNEVAWICPPVKLVIQTIRKIKSTKGKGVLICPKWPTARFWPVLFPRGNITEPFTHVAEISPLILQNQRARSILAGRVDHLFLACFY
jgi:hypothetical protein